MAADGRAAGPQPGTDTGPGPGTDPGQVDFGGVTRWLRSRGLLRSAPCDREAGAGAARPVATEPSGRLLPGLVYPAMAGHPGGAVDEPIDVRRSVAARAVTIVAAALYVWRFASWTTRHHDGFGTQAFDLGLYDQGVWLLSRFKDPFITLMGRHLFGDHTSFILLPLAPFYWLWPTAKVLLVAQAAALGGAAVPVFLLAREKLRDEWFAALLAVAYLLHPVVGWTNLEQFHPDVFEVPLALFAAWFMARERWVGFFLCLGGLMLVKEDASLLALGFGVYVFFALDRRIGLLACGLAVVYAAGAFWAILPALNGVGTLNTWRIPFGGPVGFVRTSVIHPGRVLSYVLVRDRLWYGWQLLAPVAILPLLDPGTFLIALLPLGANLVSTFPYQHDIHYHYNTLVLPILMVSTIFAIARVAAHRSVRQGLVVMTLVAAVVTAHLWGPTPLGRHEFVPADPAAPQAAAIRGAIRLIPDPAIVSSYYGWAPHVDHREKIYMFPNPWKASYWGTFKQEGQRLPQADRIEFILLPTQLDPEPKAVLDGIRAEFETVYEQGGVMLLKHRG